MRISAAMPAYNLQKSNNAQPKNLGLDTTQDIDKTPGGWNDFNQIGTGIKIVGDGLEATDFERHEAAQSKA